MSTFVQNALNDFLLQNGRLQLAKNRAQCVAIKLRNRLQFFKGEWFLDTRLGAPYFQFMYLKNPNIEEVKQLLRRIALSVPGVTDVIALSATLDRKRREFSYSMRVQVDDGSVVQGGTSEPYVVLNS